MTTRANNSRSFLGYRLNPLPQDYLARRRRIRQISTIVMTVIFSVVVAAIIIYSSNSNPGSTAH
jgi:hypothetical protein